VGLDLSQLSERAEKGVSATQSISSGHFGIYAAHFYLSNPNPLSVISTVLTLGLKRSNHHALVEVDHPT